MVKQGNLKIFPVYRNQKGYQIRKYSSKRLGLSLLLNLQMILLGKGRRFKVITVFKK